MKDYQDLVARIRQGDMTPLKQLYDNLTVRCIRYASKHGGTPDDGEDALQEAMYVFYKKVVEDDQFTLTAPPEAYVFSTFRNKLFEKFRSDKQVYLDLDDDGNPTKENTADDGLLPDDLELTHTEHPVVKLMDQLGKDCKKVLLRFYVHKQKLEEIAEDLEFTYNYVKVKRFRCGKQLRELYLNH